MSFFKKLATGQYSLAITFWIIWLVLLTAISFTSTGIIQSGYFTVTSMLIAALLLYLIKLVISVLVISGIIFMLRTKINAWRIFALILVVVEFVWSIVFLISWCMIAIPVLLNVYS